jgi:hypothetical protein
MRCEVFHTVSISLLLVLLGLGLCFSGYRFFVILLPIWGFFQRWGSIAAMQRRYRLPSHWAAGTWR